MSNRRFALTACAVVVVALLGASTQAWSSLTRVNHLTFSGPVALPGVILPAGSYTFEAGPSDTNPDVVRVTSRDGHRVLYQGFTVPVSRPAGNVPAVMFGEAPAGRATPISIWYPTQSATGHQFRY